MKLLCLHMFTVHTVERLTVLHVILLLQRVLLQRKTSFALKQENFRDFLFKKLVSLKTNYKT